VQCIHLLGGFCHICEHIVIIVICVMIVTLIKWELYLSKEMNIVLINVNLTFRGKRKLAFLSKS